MKRRKSERVHFHGNTVATSGQFQDVQNYKEGLSELTLADVFNFYIIKYIIMYSLYNKSIKTIIRERLLMIWAQVEGGIRSPV